MSKNTPAAPVRRPVALGRRDAALERSVTSSVNALEKSLMASAQRTGRPEYKTLLVDEIRPDPLNPRWADAGGVNWEEVRNPDLVADPGKKEILESIHELAKTMRKEESEGKQQSAGQQQPVQVWRSESHYQLITGERRYWALRLCGVVYIEALVFAERPTNLRMLQYVENFHHHSPKLYEQLFNLRQVISEAAELNEPINDAATFNERLGFKRSTGFRWWSVINAPEDIHAAIKDRRIESLKLGSAIAQEKDPKQRSLMLADPKAWFSDKAAVEIALNVPTTPSAVEAKAPRERGRPGQYVSFGKTTSLPVAKAIILKINAKAKQTPIDWADIRAVNRLWKDTLKSLEKQHATQDEE